MNPTDIVFPTPAVELRLRRPATETDASLDEQQAALMAAQYQLAEDLEMLRQREVNLRAYETRLRVLQSNMEGGVWPAAPSPPGRATTATDPALAAAWSKLHRARELMEVEQKHLIEGRLLLREETQALVKREAAVTVREARVTEAETLRPTQHEPKETKTGGVRGLTRAPFALAKAVFTKA